jgi:tRNA nucleotidyltransferase (CCA-adding enzyme)
MIRLPSGSRRIFQSLREAGFDCYLVGGWVRDQLLGRDGDELDFTTNARPADLLRIFRGSHYENRFGTVLVRSGGRYHEVTTYRGEGRYSDHRHPDEIRFVDTLAEDLQRRDFTINAMAIDERGEIADPFGGRADLAARLVRAVGDPAERLAEDPLRMMRAARLAVQLDLTIEPQTAAAIRRDAPMLAMISRERVRDELLKILASERPVAGIELLDDLRLLPAVLPDLANIFRDSAESRRHALGTLANTSGDTLVRLAALLHVLAEPKSGEVESDLAGLRLPNVESARVRKLIAGLAALPAEADEAAARRLLNRLGGDAEAVLALAEACAGAGGMSRPSLGTLAGLTRLVEKVRGEQQPYTLAALAIDGNDLMRDLGLPPGPGLGRLLALLLDRVLDDPSVNDRGTLLAIARDTLAPP